jgi:hypothetical protein
MPLSPIMTFDDLWKAHLDGESLPNLNDSIFEPIRIFSPEDDPRASTLKQCFETTQSVLNEAVGVLEFDGFSQALCQPPQSINKNTNNHGASATVLLPSIPTREIALSPQVPSSNDGGAKQFSPILHINCNTKTVSSTTSRGQLVLQENYYGSQASSRGAHSTSEDYCTPSSDNCSSTIQDRWTKRFQELRGFKTDCGHCSIPSHWPQNPALAQWVKRQRYQYKLMKAGQHSNLTDKRVKSLEKLGFVWDSHAVLWEERLNDLLDFRHNHGHCNIPTKYPDNPQLAIWVKCQRRRFRLLAQGVKLSTISLERIRRLQKEGFAFNPRHLKQSDA